MPQYTFCGSAQSGYNALYRFDEYEPWRVVNRADTKTPAFFPRPEIANTMAQIILEIELRR